MNEARAKSKWTIRKVFRFEAAHRLATAHSRCCSDTIHGHSYKVEVFLSSTELNKDGMVEDFGLIKERLGPLVDAWDHALLLPLPEHDGGVGFREVSGGLKTIWVAQNPTAEWMAMTLFRAGRHMNLPVSKVRVHETDTGWAEYEEVVS